MASLVLLEPIGGIAGDMFLAAAIDAGLDPGALEAALRTLDLPGWRLAISRRSSGGIAGTHVDVVVEGGGPEERSLAEILERVEGSGLSPRARAAARGVFERMGRAEAKVHGVPLAAVHFHEVGAVDSVVDVCGAAVALDLLGWPRLVCAPPELGSGTIRTAHGTIPVPPPAVLELLVGRPVRSGGPPGEAVTPTGAAILAAFAEVGELPAIVPERIGYGLGTSAWPDRPNVLRMTVGNEVPGGRHPPPSAEGDPLWVLEANLDDCPGQLVARALEACLEAGALDVWAAPVTMKKGRPGIVLGALAREERRADVTRAMLLETTTLGVRRHPVGREALAREVVEVETEYGRVGVKVALLEGREIGAQPEYEDCAARARERGVPVKEVVAAALAAHRARRGGAGA